MNYTIQTVTSLPDPLAPRQIYFVSPVGSSECTMVVIGDTEADIYSYPLDPASFTPSSDFAKSLLEATTLEEVQDLLQAAALSGSNTFTGVNTFMKSVSLRAVPIVNGAIDLSKGNVFTVSATGNLTLALSNIPPAGKMATFTLLLKNVSMSSLALWSGIKYPNGEAPGAPAVGATAIYNFMTVDGGVEWFGFFRGLYS